MPVPVMINLIIALTLLYFLYVGYRFLAGAAGGRGHHAKLPDGRTVSASVQQFKALTKHIDNGFKQNRRMPKAQEKALRAEIAHVQEHLISLLWKLDHLAAVRNNVRDSVNQVELMGMQRKLQLEIDRSLDILEQTSVALVRMDVMSEERSTARLLADLTETNQRLVETGDSYEEMQRIGRLSR